MVKDNSKLKTTEIPDHNDRDKAIQMGSYKFILGNEGEYMGYPIPCGFKINGAAKFSKDRGNYQMTIPFITMARVVGEWLRDPVIRDEFNRLLAIEKSKQVGAPDLI